MSEFERFMGGIYRVWRGKIKNYKMLPNNCFGKKKKCKILPKRRWGPSEPVLSWAVHEAGL